MYLIRRKKVIFWCRFLVVLFIKQSALLQFKAQFQLTHYPLGDVAVISNLWTSDTTWELISLVFSTGPWFNIKTPSYQYRKSHCGDKTVVRSSYLHNGISYTGKMASLYWISPLVVIMKAFSATSQWWESWHHDNSHFSVNIFGDGLC